MDINKPDCCVIFLHLFLSLPLVGIFASWIDTETVLQHVQEQHPHGQRNQCKNTDVAENSRDRLKHDNGARLDLTVPPRVALTQALTAVAQKR